MKFQYILPALAALALVGCGSGDADGYTPVPPPKIAPATVKAGDETSLLPLAVGNQWTYSVETLLQNRTGRASKKGELTFKITKVEDSDAGKKATIEVWVADKLSERQVWLVSSKGIFQVSNGIKNVVTFSTPIPIVLFPLDQHKTFSWEGTGGKLKRKITGTVLPTQEVDTDEKRFSAIGVETKGTNQDGKVIQKTAGMVWFTPGVGLVRYRESTASNTTASEQLLKLKSHSLK